MRNKMSFLEWMVAAWWGFFDRQRSRYMMQQWEIGKTEWAGYESARLWNKELQAASHNTAMACAEQICPECGYKIGGPFGCTGKPGQCGFFEA